MAGPGLLPEEPAALAFTVPRVPGHQVGQEALCAGRHALPLAPFHHVPCAGAPRGLTPGQPHGALQQLGGPVVQRGGDLQIQTLEQGRAGHGL